MTEQRRDLWVGGRTITVTFPGDPPVTRARVAAAGLAEPPATREAPAAGPEGDRPGRVAPVEQAALRGSLGWLLYGERAASGWSQEVLAARAKVGLTTVRDLESGRVRPSDRMTRRLAEALAFNRDLVSVAVLDLRFQRAAGHSLRRWKRRRPPRVAVQRIYAEARRRLDAEDAEDAARKAEREAGADAFMAEFQRQWRQDPAPAGRPMSPAEAWPGRWPRVRG